jgi:fumarate hydratase class II
MPGKVNPTQCEMLMMVCTQIFGNDTTISFANSQGNFEINTFLPLIAYNSIHSVNLLADAITSFTTFCIEGIKFNKSVIDKYVKDSVMQATVLTPILGYEKVAKLTKYATQNNMSLQKAASVLGYIREREFKKIVDPKKMV